MPQPIIVKVASFCKDWKSLRLAYPSGRLYPRRNAEGGWNLLYWQKIDTGYSRLRIGRYYRVEIRLQVGGRYQTTRVQSYGDLYVFDAKYPNRPSGGTQIGSRKHPENLCAFFVRRARLCPERRYNVRFIDVTDTIKERKTR